MLDPVLRKVTQYVSRLSEDEFREFGSSGRIFHKADILALFAGESAATLTLENFQANQLASDVFLVTYGVGRHSAEGFVVSSLRSSIWILRDARWQMLFHQGTKAY